MERRRAERAEPVPGAVSGRGAHDVHRGVLPGRAAAGRVPGQLGGRLAAGQRAVPPGGLERQRAGRDIQPVQLPVHPLLCAAAGGLPAAAPREGGRLGQPEADALRHALKTQIENN